MGLRLFNQSDTLMMAGKIPNDKFGEDNYRFVVEKTRSGNISIDH